MPSSHPMQNPLMYIWQHSEWPEFRFDKRFVKQRVQELLKAQAKLGSMAKALPEPLENHAMLDAMIQNAIKTSAIEGEFLNVESVRSSVARHLGLEQGALPKEQQREKALVAMLLAALEKPEKPISKNTLCQWQSQLFVEPPRLRPISIGKFRDDALGPMQVVSEIRTQGKTIVHFEAPPAKSLNSEINAFLRFYNNNNGGNSPYHPILKAALAHLYFITVHPFDDGNGRIARALTDRALARFEQSSIRFYSLSAAIEANKTGYYQILESTQNGKTPAQQKHGLDVTQWLEWFFDTLEQAIHSGVAGVERVLLKTWFWQQHAQTVLSSRQIKVLNRLLDSYGMEFQEGIASRHYQSIAGVSKATATRDLNDLQEKGCIVPTGAGGRSVRYQIPQNL